MEPWKPTFKRDAVDSSETLITIYQTAWFRNPEDHNRNLHRHEILESDEAVLNFNIRGFL
jgi:hypothetical protein